MYERDQLYEYIKENAFYVLDKKIELSSGIKSRMYFDTRKILLSTRGQYLVRQIYYNTFIRDLENDIWKTRRIAIGGIEAGAIPLITLIISELMRYDPHNIRYGFFVRKQRKAHGLKKIIEGNITNKDYVYLVDDVVTTGESIYQCIKTLESEVYDDANKNMIMGVLPLIDRSEELGIDLEEKLFSDYGIDYKPIFKSTEFLH